MHKIGIVSVSKSISTVLQRKKFFIYRKPQLQQNYIPFTMESPATKDQVSIRISIDKEKNKVLFVQAGSDFVDVLLSFLTLPLGTIARLVKKVRVGSISSLYESVANLDEKHFLTPTCKEMLLQPRNSMEAYCQNLKLNIDDTEKTKYFICDDWNCSKQSSGGLLTTFRNQRCKCGKLMNRETVNTTSSVHKGFVSETTSFIILDELFVRPDDFENTIGLPMYLGYENLDSIEMLTVNVTQKEILDLLKCSLFSNTPLTDVFLSNKQFVEVAQPQPITKDDFDAIEANDPGETIKVKVMVRKSSNTILFALGKEDFVDFLLSFLTFPLGGVENMLNGKSLIGSIDNLYKSILDLNPNIHLRSTYLRNELVKTRLAHQFKIWNQLLPINEVLTYNYSCCIISNLFGKKISSYLVPSNIKGVPLSHLELQSSTGKVSSNFNNGVHLSYLEPRSSTGEVSEQSGGNGFAKSSSLYMVTDDLVIAPGSSTSTISFLTNLKIPPSDLEERVMSIGKKEGLSLLKASLISSSALTNGLGPFLQS